MLVASNLYLAKIYSLSRFFLYFANKKCVFYFIFLPGGYTKSMESSLTGVVSTFYVAVYSILEKYTTLKKLATLKINTTWIKQRVSAYWFRTFIQVVLLFYKTRLYWCQINLHQVFCVLYVQIC